MLTENNIEPKISIIIPVCNVEKYLSECLDSVINQTLKEIEIICVDDGSTDSSPKILDEYAEKDNRIVVIHKPNAGYGHTMNIGLDHAHGKYVAFLESDDFITENAYEILYDDAEEYSVDIIKANYSEFSGKKPSYKIKNKSLLSGRNLEYYQVYDPKETPSLFYVPMMNVLGLFRMDMLNQNSIRHNETPGASHQDMGFWFQTFCVAKKVLFIPENLYQYRQDNPNSSINNPHKVFCIRDEYRFMGKFLDYHADILNWCAPIYYHRMFGSFLYHYNNLIPEYKPLFVYEGFHPDFCKAKLNGTFDDSRFSDKEKTIIEKIISSPWDFISESVVCLDKNFVNQQNITLQEKISEYNSNLKKIKKLESERNKTQSKLDHVYKSTSFKIGRAATWAPRKINSFTRKSIKAIEGKIDSQKKKNINVSVIIPVFNVAPYLCECLDSLCAQTLNNIEIICVDDGSSDNSLKILNQYAKSDSRVRVFSQNNSGAGVARNLGMKHARGKYLCFVDSDDFFDPDMLKESYLLAEKTSAEIVMFRHDRYDHQNKRRFNLSHMMNAKNFPENNPFTVSDMKENFYLKIYGWTWDKLFLRSFVLKNELYFQSTKSYNDMFFTYSALVSANKISYMDRVFMCQRVNRPGQITKTVQSTWPCIFESLAAVRDYLIKIKKYEKYQKYFSTYALHMILFNYRQLDGTAKEDMAKVITDKHEKELGLDFSNSALFENKGELEEIQALFEK